MPAATHGSAASVYATTGRMRRVRRATSANTTATSGGPLPKSRLNPNPASVPSPMTAAHGREEPNPPAPFPEKEGGERGGVLFVSPPFSGEGPGEGFPLSRRNRRHIPATTP